MCFGGSQLESLGVSNLFEFMSQPGAIYNKWGEPVKHNLCENKHLYLLWEVNRYSEHLYLQKHEQPEMS